MEDSQELGVPRAPDVPLELRDFEAFIAYEVGFEKEADSSLSLEGLCKALHDRVMVRASSSGELESQLLLSLLAAFVFMDDCINKAEDERQLTVSAARWSPAPSARRAFHAKLTVCSHTVGRQAGIMTAEKTTKLCA